MVKHDQRLAVLLVIALLICFIHAIQLKHRKEGGALTPEMSYVWLRGAVQPAIYALPASGVTYKKLFNFLGPLQTGRAVQGLFRSKSRKSYEVSQEGDFREIGVSYQAAPFFYLPIPLNRTDAKTLMMIAGIGKVLSKRIIAYRDTHGLFTSLEGLLLVDGVGQKKFNKMRSYLSIYN